MTTSYLMNYIGSFDDSTQKDSICRTASNVYNEIYNRFLNNQCGELTGLLFGQVQSGKTSQMLGVISKLADEGFRFYILLTTDNRSLQEQTLERTYAALPDFDVLDEGDELKFRAGALRKPTILVLKKNTNILKKWRNIILNSSATSGNTIVIFDDEADAASLNTLINKNEVSAINQHLDAIKKNAGSCIYIQVTATPQSVLLQSEFSDWKPKFVTFFEPGNRYHGGDYYYSDPDSYCIRYTGENELDGIRNDDMIIPSGLQDSLLSFLVVAAQFKLVGKKTCTFLIHPSIKTEDHHLAAECIGHHLNLLFRSIDEQEVQNSLHSVWNDLQGTQPDIQHFDDIIKCIQSMLNNEEVKVRILNSKSEDNYADKTGYNIIVGGNNLGRGITLPNLQTVYYCRKSKSPQADTVWQHSRIFGYDRIPGLVRIYISRSLHRLFVNVNKSNKILSEQFREKNGIDGIQILLPPGVRPTRPNVLKKDILSIVTGGVNYFPDEPCQNNLDDLHDILEGYSNDNHEISFDVLLNIFEKIGEFDSEDWDKEKFKNCIIALKSKRPQLSIYLLVKRDRDISKGTGTLLSANDRQIVESFKESITLVLYEIIGSVEKGWEGNSFWIPNIKFPQDLCFYDTINV